MIFLMNLNQARWVCLETHRESKSDPLRAVQSAVDPMRELHDIEDLNSIIMPTVLSNLLEQVDKSKYITNHWMSFYFVISKPNYSHHFTITSF